jgi:threonine dehydrogenase-like Zn-dependent dehydrogenase
MLITHKMPFSQVKEAFELFRNKPEFCIKIAIMMD